MTLVAGLFVGSLRPWGRPDARATSRESAQPDPIPGAYHLLATEAQPTTRYSSRPEERTPESESDQDAQPSAEVHVSTQTGNLQVRDSDPAQLTHAATRLQELDELPYELGQPSVRTYELTLSAMRVYWAEASAGENAPSPLAVAGYLMKWQEVIRKQSGQHVSLLQLGEHFCRIMNTSRIYAGSGVTPRQVAALYASLFTASHEAGLSRDCESIYVFAEEIEEHVSSFIIAIFTYDSLATTEYGGAIVEMWRHILAEE